LAVRRETYFVKAPKGHDDYLAALSDDKRRALERLRKDISVAAPQSEECMSYGLPGFRLNGKLLVSYGAGAKHCAFYPGSIVREFAGQLKSYDTSGKGTIRFSPDKPLPSALVRKIVKARIEQRGQELDGPRMDANKREFDSQIRAYSRDSRVTKGRAATASDRPRPGRRRTRSSRP
jgi:uncharacterized protein YdhG (YjbR/CyaY superfamily)